MKGIVLAGGTGSRLWPITRSVSKQLLPIYDKPMIYYPISTLMLAGIREILIITTPHDQSQFKELLGDGSELGISFKYATQPEPKGLAQALVIGESFLSGDSCLMILGDNIFYGVGLGSELRSLLPSSGCHIFTSEVENPSQYGVLTLDKSGNPMNIEEKPLNSSSSLAVTGLYYFDNRATKLAYTVKPSARGEFEITDLISKYLKIKELSFTNLARGTTWLDTGTFESLHNAGTFVRLMEERSGLRIAQLQEISWRNGWISDSEIMQFVENSPISTESKYLKKIIREDFRSKTY